VGVDIKTFEQVLVMGMNEELKLEIIEHLKRDSDTWKRLSIDAGEESISDLSLIKRLEEVV
jgi:hypothetical protein